MLLVDGCDVVSRAQHVQRLDAGDTSHHTVALLVVRPGWQTDHGLLRHALSVYLLRRGSLLRHHLRVAQVLRVQASLLLHVAVQTGWLGARLLLLHLLMLLLLVLEVLQGGLHLQAFLQVVESGVLQPTVAYQVIKLVPGLDNIQIQSVIKPNYILLLEDANVSIDIQVLQVLLPHIKAYHAHYIAQYLLERRPLPIVLIRPVKRALYDYRIKVRENFVFFENH